MHGATATPQSYYRRFAESLAKSGFRVVTYDYRGVGASRPPSLRGFRATMTDWARRDAAAVHRHVREAFGDGPIAVVGHSFGGQLLGLLDAPADIAGAVLVGAQLGYFGHWPLVDRVKLGLLWHAVVPTVTATWGYLPGRLGTGEDLPRGVADEWAAWCRSPEYLVDHHPEAAATFSRYRCPVLLYSFTDDWYAPRAAVDAFVARLSSAPLTHRRVEPRDHGGPIGHFGFFRPRFEDTLWQEVHGYLSDLFEGRPPTIEPAREPWFRDVMADLEHGRG